MPTGYTAAIKDGITFEQFLWSCARGMGALVMMREEPADAPIPERFEPSNFYANKAEAAKAEVIRLRSLSMEAAEREADAHYSEACGRHQDYLQEAADLQAKYKTMLAHVLAWQAPTPDHDGFKDFMVEQIESSIRFDCDTSYLDAPTKQSGGEWLVSQIEINTRMAIHCAQLHREEVERTEGRNAWLKALRDSLLVKRPRDSQGEAEVRA